LVARKKNQVLGFITCKVEGSNGGLSRGVIDLVGVGTGLEGRGVGACLVGEALKWFSSRTKTVQVGTQAANIGAARLYEKMGFRMVSSEATLHLWVSSR
jgi:ribosomal protein S18 acetylase RimI-like enzyme